MEIKKIESLIKLFGGSDLYRLELEEKDVKVVLERQKSTTALGIEHSARKKHVTSQEETTKKIDETKIRVTAPLVGTLYLSPEPDKPSFVKVKDRVKKGQTIAIIEAMKMMNEVKAPADGTIAAVLVENATVVEYDQVLFKIEN